LQSGRYDIIAVPSVISRLAAAIGAFSSENGSTLASPAMLLTSAMHCNTPFGEKT
jgi:hypothetical protein